MNILDLQRKKIKQEKITMITCYDYPSARILNDTTIDCVLVGDTVAMTVHGHPNTLMADIEMMTLHTEAVARGLKHGLLISDLPFLGHRISKTETFHNVKRLLQAGAEAIKIEGGDVDTCATIEALTFAGIPIIGHIGLTPQSIHQLGGFKVQGKSEQQAAVLLCQAKALEQAGCKAIVIECVPQLVAKTITEALTIPTIGIGAGLMTDGQVLVWHDLLGLQDELMPRFLKQYAQCKPLMIEAINCYAKQVRECHFPSEEHVY
jgi:3-methyl-2-oxobutanoate hydroxymethyltransferase